MAEGGGDAGAEGDALVGGAEDDVEVEARLEECGRVRVEEFGDVRTVADLGGKRGGSLSLPPF